MNYTINNELEVSVIKSNPEDGTIKFEVNFIKYGFKDTYGIKLKDIDTYISKKIKRPTKGEYYFYPINNHFLFFYNKKINKEQIDAVERFLINKITALGPTILLTQENNEELNQCISEKRSYSEHLMRPIRDFSLKMDTIALYQGEHLDNLSYSVMRDYMNRSDTIVEITSAYEVNPNRQRSFVETLKNFQPEKEETCEIYIYAKVSFKDIVVNSPSPFYIGITFVTLERLLGNINNFVSNSNISKEIYIFNNFFALKTYNYSKIEYVIKQVVGLWTEAIPAQHLAERLSNSFDIYHSDPLIFINKV